MLRKLHIVTKTALILAALGYTTPWEAWGDDGVHCPPRAGEGATKPGDDIDDDNVKDWRYDGANRFRETFRDGNGSRIEMWCIDHGAGSQFVRMYIPGAGKPLAAKRLFIAHCKYVGGNNEPEETKQTKMVDGEKKEEFKDVKWKNIDRDNEDATEKHREYTYHAPTGKLKQVLTKDNGTVVTEVEGATPPDEAGRGIRLPMAPMPPPPPAPPGGSGGGSAPDSPGGIAGPPPKPVDQAVTHIGVSGAVPDDHSSDPGTVPIPDDGLATSRITVAASPITFLREVHVDLEISHARIGDLVVQLEHGEHTATLVNRIGQKGGAGPGCDSTGLDCTIDDDEPTPVHDACAPGSIITGRFSADSYSFAPGPAPPQSVFHGGAATGNWTLRIIDAQRGAEGALVRWHLHLAGDGDTGPGSVQSAISRRFQETLFPQLIHRVESMGISPTGESNRFWWDLPGEEQVGPVEIKSVGEGSPAARAGLKAGDVIEGLFNIPGYLTSLKGVQTVGLLGGSTQLGHEIERNWEFGLSSIGLIVSRGGDSRMVMMLIGAPPPACAADFNDDLVVDGKDLAGLLASWGPCAAPCLYDLDRSGAVNSLDLAMVLAAWGPCP